MEHHATLGLRLHQTHAHDGGRHSGGLCTLLAHLYLGLLKHLRHAELAACKLAEVGLRGEDERRTQLCYYLIERLLHLGGEARELQIHVTLSHVAEQSLILLSVHPCHYLTHRFALCRQQHCHAVGSVTVGDAHSLVAFAVGIIVVIVAVHHAHTLHVTRIAAERFHLGLLLVKLISPRSIEVDGVHQVGYSLWVNLVDDAGNHAVGLVGAPAVDALERLGGSEVQALHARLIVSLHRLLELAVHLEAVVHCHIIGNVHLHIPVHMAGLLHHHARELVDVPQRRLVLSLTCPAQGGKHLLLGVAAGAIGQHAHQVGDAQGRYYAGVHTHGLAEEIEGKVIVLPHHLALCIRQHQMGTVDVLAHTPVWLIVSSSLFHSCRAAACESHRCCAHQGHSLHHTFHICLCHVLLHLKRRDQAFLARSHRL